MLLLQCKVLDLTLCDQQCIAKKVKRDCQIQLVIESVYACTILSFETLELVEGVYIFVLLEVQATLGDDM